jgi:hypoxanthine-DNA glycosylase
MQNRISSFPPIIDNNSKILILGSIPGVKSLEKQQYYAHPQNKFWKIIFELLNEKFTENYAERINILKKHHIALWDVIDSCERKAASIRRSEMKKPTRLQSFWKTILTLKLFFVTVENLTKTYRKF